MGASLLPDAGVRFAEMTAGIEHYIRVGDDPRAAAVSPGPALRPAAAHAIGAIERREGGDFFGNRMTWIELDQPHDDLGDPRLRELPAAAHVPRCVRHGAKTPRCAQPSP